MTPYDRHADRAYTLLTGLWRYVIAFEDSDERVVEASRKDLEELQGRINRLLRRNAKAA